MNGGDPWQPECERREQQQAGMAGHAPQLSGGAALPTVVAGSRVQLECLPPAENPTFALPRNSPSAGCSPSTLLCPQHQAESWQPLCHGLELLAVSLLHTGPAMGSTANVKEAHRPYWCTSQARDRRTVGGSTQPRLTCQIGGDACASWWCWGGVLAAASRLGWLAAAREVVGTAGRRVEAAILRTGLS